MTATGGVPAVMNSNVADPPRTAKSGIPMRPAALISSIHGHADRPSRSSGLCRHDTADRRTNNGSEAGRARRKTKR